MKNQHNNPDAAGSDNQAVEKVRVVHPIVPGTGTLVNGGHDADKQQDGDDLQDALEHGSDYAPIRPRRIASAAEAGFAVGAQIKADNAKLPADKSSQALGAKLDALLTAPASTATDALAFATIQECILRALDLNQFPEPQRCLLDRAFYLNLRMVHTLQIATGLHRSVFTGDGPSAN